MIKVCKLCGAEFSADDKRRKTCSDKCRRELQCIGYKRPKRDEVFDWLTVLEKSSEKLGRGYLWKCQCVCGNIVYAMAYQLYNGLYTSCGCKKVKHAKEQIKVEQLKVIVEHTTPAYILKNSIPRDNKSGQRCVSWHRHSGKWRVCIYFQKKAYELGYFSDFDEAAQLAKTAIDLRERCIVEKTFFKFHEVIAEFKTTK